MLRIHLFGLCFYSLVAIGSSGSIGDGDPPEAKSAMPRGHDLTKIDAMPREAPRCSVSPQDQWGVASWYGPHFQGRRTASGRRFNMRELTAAHRTLPLGSEVRVTNLENGRSVEVKISDRGPYFGGRIIDLSKAAALRLGITRRDGVALVRLEPVTAIAAYD